MPDGNLVIDCGSADPFLPNRQVQKESDQKIALRDPSGTIIRRSSDVRVRRLNERLEPAVRHPFSIKT